MSWEARRPWGADEESVRLAEFILSVAKDLLRTSLGGWEFRIESSELRITEGVGGWKFRIPNSEFSTLFVPHRAVRRVLDHDPALGQLIADLVGSGEISCRPGG